MHRRSLLTTVPLVAVLLMAGWSSRPPSGRAEARSIFSPSAYARDLSAAQFATEAARIGSLRGMDTREILRRFTAEARLQSHAKPGQSTGGGSTIATNWSLSPAGTQSPLGDFPVHSTLSPDGTHMLVVNSGAGIQALQVVDV